MFTFVKNLFSIPAVIAVSMTAMSYGVLIADIQHTLQVESVEVKVTPNNNNNKTIVTPKPKHIEEVIDVKASIHSWNKEAWCRKHWDNGIKCWFKDRQEQYPLKAKAIAKAFKAIWGKSPIQVQKLALSICLKETGCGFSEQRNFRKSDNKISQTGERTYKASKFMSNKEACGLTQVDTREKYGKVRCSVLNASYENAFKWQKKWLETYWNDGHKVAPTKVDLYNLDWLKPYQIDKNNTSYLIWRYNGGGKGAWKYGRIVMKIYHNHIVTKKVEVNQ